MIGEVLGHPVDGCFHGWFGFIPSGGADFAMGFGELESIDHAEHFVDITSEGEVVDDLVAHDTGFVDEEGSPQRDTGSKVEVVAFGDFFGDIGDQWVLNVADTAFVDWGIFPGQVGEVGVDGDTDDFDTAGFKFFEAVVEGDDFGRADEGKVEGIKEKDDVFAFER